MCRGFDQGTRSRSVESYNEKGRRTLGHTRKSLLELLRNQSQIAAVASQSSICQLEIRTTFPTWRSLVS